MISNQAVNGMLEEIRTLRHISTNLAFSLDNRLEKNEVDVDLLRFQEIHSKWR